jgi:DNA repair exonuclease SbcCD ATPase subunit
MMDNGEPWKIERTWGPNSWTLHKGDSGKVEDLTKDQANPILQALRLEFEAFLQCVLMAQNRPMFLDLKQDAQASLFSNVLGIERWMDYSTKASKKASAQDATTRDLERQHSKLTGELEALSRQDFSKSHDEWEVQRMKKLLELEADHKEGIAKRKKLKEELLTAEEVEAFSRKDVQDSKMRTDVEDLLEDKTGELRALEDELLQERQKGKALAQAYDNVSKESTCPTCGKGLSKQERLEHLGKIDKNLKAVHAMERRLTDLVVTCSKEHQELAERHRKDLEARERCMSRLEQAQRDVSAARRALELHDRELDRIEDRAEEVEQEPNPYANMAQEARRTAARLREALQATQRSLDASQERYGLLSYWVKGFKEIRLQEIASALTELEIEANSSVTALGLLDWELNFQVDRETKGGSLQRGFNVLVRSPKYSKPTPWEAWSGGESQRLRLAANAGLSDLIRSRTGTTLDLEVWDEPTNGLSPEGLNDLLQFLTARAEKEQRQVWLVDHRAFDFGGFAGEATVVKAPSGSRIRTSW